MTEQTISLERLEDTISLFGSFDENIRLIEHELGVSVISRDSQLKVSGEDPEQVLFAVHAIENLMGLAARGEAINEQNVRYVLQLVREGREQEVQQLSAGVLCITAKGKPIKAKTLGQKKYIEAIQKNVVTLGIGPAGTGKTYLAVAAAVAVPAAVPVRPSWNWTAAMCTPASTRWPRSWPRWKSAGARAARPAPRPACRW